MATAIEFDHVGKQYRLGLVTTKTLSHDLNRWWQTSILGKEDPYLKIGETNDRSVAGNSEYVWALRDIDFKVEQGDVVGIIGKNGAGKSTLLKLLSKVTGPTVGTIRARGRIGSLLEVGTGFHPEMTGRENIYMNGAIMGMTKNDISRKLDEIVAFSGCERYIDTPVKRYSSGMTVRLGFAVAAHLEPEILVVDEVLAVGDAEFQKKAIGKMQDVSRGEGRTVLFVSHNMTSVRALCKNGVLLENGMVKYTGTIDETIYRYLAVDSSKVGFDSDLSDRSDRSGSGAIQMVSISFKNLKGDITYEAFYGDWLEIEMHFKKHDDRINNKDIVVSCGFEDKYGNRLNEWVSDEMKHEFSECEDVIRLVVPTLILRPDTYFFHYKLMLYNTGEENICDQMHFAKKIYVNSLISDDLRLKNGRGSEVFMPASFK